MHKKSPFTAMIAILAGTAFAADDRNPMSLGYAQQESGKSVEEVKAADVPPLILTHSERPHEASARLDPQRIEDIDGDR